MTLEQSPQLLDRDPRRAEETAERARSEFSMKRNRECLPASILCEDHVASVLASRDPIVFFERADEFLAGDDREPRHRNLDRDGSDLDALFRSALGLLVEDEKYPLDRFMDIGEGLLLRLALGDTPGERRALRDKPSTFIGTDHNAHLHAEIVADGAVGSRSDR